MVLPNMGVSVYLTPFVSDSRDIHISAYRIAAITPPLQGGDAGSIPATRSDRLVIPRSHRLQASYHRIGWSLLEDTGRRFSGWRNRYRFSVLMCLSSVGRADDC